MLVVQKYGGSSLATVNAVRAVAARVVARHQRGDELVVVVSAMGKTTDSLLAMAREAAADPSSRELDMLLTAGERISMALLSMAIISMGHGAKAVSFTGSQSGIVTEAVHGGARIVEIRPLRVREALDAGCIVIVAGYQGVSTEREVTTLGRGGSDTTAVALAQALGADSCEIYSDVDGIYTADPATCPGARHIAAVDYETVLAAAASGARVLHPEAIRTAQKGGVAVQARSVSENARATTITKERSEDALCVVGTPYALRIHAPLEVWPELTEKLAAAQPFWIGGGVDAADVLLSLSHESDQRAWLSLLTPLSSIGVSAQPTGSVALVGHRHTQYSRRAWARIGACTGWFVEPLRQLWCVAPEAVAASVQAVHALI